MKKVTWLPFDLQFFADGEGASEGAEEAGAAEQPEGETGAEGAEEDSEEGEEQPEEDRDAIYAQARRRAESEARERIAREQAEEDAYWVRECQGKVNPETGAPITSYADYKEALEAQKRVAMKTELQNKGVDPSIIESSCQSCNPERPAHGSTGSGERSPVDAPGGHQRHYADGQVFCRRRGA